MRATDRRGNSSPYTPERRTAAPLRAAALERSSAWRREPGSGLYLGSALLASARGSRLVLRGVEARRLVLVATACPGCGRVRVTWNGRLLREVSLGAPATRHGRLVPLATFRTARPGTLALELVSDGAPVVIEGVGVSRA